MSSLRSAIMVLLSIPLIYSSLRFSSNIVPKPNGFVNLHIHSSLFANLASYRPAIKAKNFGLCKRNLLTTCLAVTTSTAGVGLFSCVFLTIFGYMLAIGVMPFEGGSSQLPQDNN